MKKAEQQLPQLAMLLGWPTERLWYPISGMYGGYGIRLATIAEIRDLAKGNEELWDGEEFGLIADSFVRIWCVCFHLSFVHLKKFVFPKTNRGGSEQWHYISVHGCVSVLQE